MSELSRKLFSLLLFAAKAKLRACDAKIAPEKDKKSGRRHEERLWLLCSSLILLHAADTHRCEVYSLCCESY